MRKLLLSIALVFVVSLAIFYVPAFFSKPSVDNKNQPQTTILQLGDVKLSVELAQTPDQITKGLSGREQLPQEGLLFVLPQRVQPAFWMKEMKFGLDFVWIDGDSVVDITHDVPAPSPETPLNELILYRPKQPVTHVLEIGVGSAREKGIQIGDKVTYLKRAN